MATYVAYNKMYYKGKSIGRKFVAYSGTTEAAVKQKATKGNKRWNSLKQNRNYRTVTVEIKRVGETRKRKKQRKTSSLFSFSF